MKSISIFLILFLSINAWAWGTGGSTSTDGTSTKPYELVIGGDKRVGDDPEKYYSFVSLIAQKVTIYITEHDTSSSWSNKDLTLKLHPQEDDGSCSSTTLQTSPTQDGEFNWDINVNATKYCLSVSGNGDYTIQLDGDAQRKVGINDAQANEADGTISFIVALTKASQENDITVNYSFEDGSALHGVNYNGNTGTNSVIIEKGNLNALINVPIYNTNMSTTKDFTVTITSNDVNISDDSKTATGSIIGSIDADYEGPDICYDSRETSGICMFGSCIFYKEKTKVLSKVPGLGDINVKKSLTRGMAFLDFASEIGVDDDKKTLDEGDDEAEKTSFVDSDFSGYYSVSMFPKGIDYGLGKDSNKTKGGSLSKDERTSYYDSSLFKFGLFTQYTTLVTYTKGGETYQEVLQACDPDTNGNMSLKPALEECGMFLGSLNSKTKIKFSSTSWQTINFQSDLNTPLVEGSTGRCNNRACNADGVGSNEMALPVFLTSTDDKTYNIPYSMVIAEQQVGNLVTTTDTKTAENEDNRTIIFEAPYSPSYKGRVMLINSITDSDNHADLYHYVFKEGDYWIKKWDFTDKSKTITIETVGKVRFFIKDAFNLQASGSEIHLGYHVKEGETSTCSDPHFYMYLYDNFTINAGGSSDIKNGYIYSKGHITIGGDGALASYYTAITADGIININTKGAGAYTFNNAACVNDETSELFKECTGGGVYYHTGPFGAWDTDSNIANKIIKTKVAAKNFNLTIASLNPSGNETEVKETIDMRYRLYDFDTSHPVTAWQTYNASTGVDGESQTKAFSSITSAYKNVRVQFEFCAESSDNSLVLHPLSYCDNDVLIDTNTSTFSADNFAIRPDQFMINAPTGKDIELLASGDVYKMKLTAVQYSSNITTPKYDLVAANTILSVTGDKFKPDGTLDNTLHGNLSFGTSTFNMKDGTSLDSSGNNEAAGVSFNDVGLVNIKIQDRKWAKVDIDNNDTVADCSENGAYVCGDINATFIPDHFEIDTIALNNYTDGTTKSFTYLSNDLNISAAISLNVKAKNKLGDTTQNFDKDSWENNVIAGFTIAGTPSTPNKNEMTTAVDLDFVTGAQTISNTQTDTTKNLIFNFTRVSNAPQNPFKVNGTDVNTTVSSLYTSSSGNSITVKGSSLATADATFVYGRTHALRQRFVGSSGTAFIYYENYCNGTGCDKSLLPQTVGNPPTPTDDPRWFVNKSHFSAAGNVGTVNQKIGSDVTAGTPTGTAKANVALTYNSSSKGYPFKTTMENNASSWLIYNKYNAISTTNEFEVEFTNGSNSWAGQHETNTTTNASSSSKTNRRTMW